MISFDISPSPVSRLSFTLNSPILHLDPLLNFLFTETELRPFGSNSLDSPSKSGKTLVSTIPQSFTIVLAALCGITNFTRRDGREDGRRSSIRAEPRRG